MSNFIERRTVPASRFDELEEANEQLHGDILTRQEEIERQHNEITELNGRLTDALRMIETLEIEKDNLASELIEANSAKDVVDHFANAVARELDSVYMRADRAIESLRVLEEVPLGDLVTSIGAIIEGLKA